MSYRVADHRLDLLDRHARVAILIDRLRSPWTLCTYDEDRGDYEPIDKGCSEELITELKWLNDLYAEALATDGDVRRSLALHGPAAPADGADAKVP